MRSVRVFVFAVIGLGLLSAVPASAEAGLFWRVTHPFAARRAANASNAPTWQGQACGGQACALPTAQPTGNLSPPNYRAP